MVTKADLTAAYLAFDHKRVVAYHPLPKPFLTKGDK